MFGSACGRNTANSTDPLLSLERTQTLLNHQREVPSAARSKTPMAHHVTTPRTNVLDASVGDEGLEALKNLVAYVGKKEKVNVDGTVGVDQCQVSAFNFIPL